jgi:hypothetical protein
LIALLADSHKVSSIGFVCSFRNGQVLNFEVNKVSRGSGACLAPLPPFDQV